MGWIGRVSASQADLLAALRRPWPGRSASSWSAVSRLGGASAVRTPRAPPLSCPARGGVGSVGGDPVPGLPCRPDGAPPGVTRHDRGSPEPGLVPGRGQRPEGGAAIRRGVEELWVPEASSDDRPALIEASARAPAGTRNQERERPSMASGASVRWKPAAPWPRAASTPLKAAPSGGDTRAPCGPRLISRSPGCGPWPRAPCPALPCPALRCPALPCPALPITRGMTKAPSDSDGAFVVPGASPGQER